MNSELTKLSEQLVHNAQAPEWTEAQHKAVKNGVAGVELLKKLISLICEEAIPEIENEDVREKLEIVCRLVQSDFFWTIADLVVDLFDEEENN